MNIIANNILVHSWVIALLGVGLGMLIMYMILRGE